MISDKWAGKIMIKKLISICIITILVCNIYGCAWTVGEMFAVPKVCIGKLGTSSTKSAEQEDQPANAPVLQEEPEPEKEIDFDGSDIHRSILTEYERAWKDETYTVEEWQYAAGVFMTLTDGLWTKTKDYTLYYSMSDLTGDETEELIIGVQDEDGIAPCFIYTGDGERIHMTDSRTGSDLIKIPTILYENGIIESAEHVKSEEIKYGMYRYNFYQLPKDLGKMKKIDQYFYIEGLGNGTRYYKNDMANTVTEEEFWDGIDCYESMPQIELNWHELIGFWGPDKDGAKTTENGEGYWQSGKAEGADDEVESSETEKTTSKEEKEKSKKDGPLTVMSKKTRFDIDGSVHMWEEYEYDGAGNMTRYTGYLGSDGSFWFGNVYEYDSKSKLIKDTYYGADGDLEYWNEYEYDHEGNQVKHIRYDSDGSIHTWEEFEYDSVGNQIKYTHHNADDSIDYWEEYKYDSAGNQVKRVQYSADDDISYWYEYEYDNMGNQTKTIEYNRFGDIDEWYEWEYDDVGNMTKKNNNFLFLYEYEYDDVGNQTKCSYYTYYSNGSIADWNEYEYDSAGNLTKNTTYNADGGIQSTQTYEYDNRGNKTKAMYDYVYGIPTGHESEHEWEYMWEYDSMGNLTKYMEYWWGGVFDWYEYEYITIIPQ